MIMKRYIRKSRKSVVFFAASNFAAAVSSVFLSYLLGMFAKIALAGAWDHLWLLAAGTLGYIFLDTYLQYLMEYTKASAIHKIERDLRSDLLRKIERLRYEEKCRQEDGYYLSILNNDVPVIEGEYRICGAAFW